MTLLDTNVCVGILHSDPKVASRLDLRIENWFACRDIEKQRKILTGSF